MLRISDTDFAMQYNFGIMLQPWEHTRIGLRYLTETDLDFEDDPDLSWRDPIGQALGQPDTKLDLGVKMPQLFHAGIHHQWNEDLALCWPASAGRSFPNRVGVCALALGARPASLLLW